MYSPSPFNASWLALQTSFLARTAGSASIEFGIFLNGVAPDLSGSDVHVIAASSENLGHATALTKVLEYFRSQDDRADGYLFLDSDCFPVHPDWVRALIDLMQRHGKHFAAPVRFENLEPYPHPCALYIDGASVDDPRLRFEDAHRTANLLGYTVCDVGAGLLPIQADTLPLMRSNARNPHPVAAALYNHLFYHHGAGSRHFGFRAINQYDYYAPARDSREVANEVQLLEALLRDPDRFLAHLSTP